MCNWKKWRTGDLCGIDSVQHVEFNEFSGDTALASKWIRNVWFLEKGLETQKGVTHTVNLTKNLFFAKHRSLTLNRCAKSWKNAIIRRSWYSVARKFDQQNWYWKQIPQFALINIGGFQHPCTIHSVTLSVWIYRANPILN